MTLGVVMDPIQNINPKKDTTLAMLLEAQKRDEIIYYMEINDLFFADGQAAAAMRRLTVFDRSDNWFEFGVHSIQPLSELDVILMRKDPPFDMEYIYATYLLELAEAKGTLVINKPQSLRDANEKLFTCHFPQCCPETLVSSDQKQLFDFQRRFKQVVFKPLDSMGGRFIFLIQENDPNTKVIIETLTHFGTRMIMAQKFIPEVQTEGDKRIILINGEPVPYALARVPAQGEIRGNLAAGGQGTGVAITERERWICQQLSPTLQRKGLIFVGIDVIGGYLTEINVTSPTCVREIDDQFGTHIARQLFDWIEAKIQNGVKSL